MNPTELRYELRLMQGTVNRRRLIFKWLHLITPHLLLVGTSVDDHKSTTHCSVSFFVTFYVI